MNTSSIGKTKAIMHQTINLSKITILPEVLVIIPAYNESKNIVKTVNTLKSALNIDYLIVEDCSTDNTAAVIKKHNFNAIFNKKNLGLSGAFREGVKYAIDKGYKYVIQYDGDGQHNPEDIPNMIFYAQKGYDIVVTSRYVNTNNNLSNSKKTAHKWLRCLFKLTTRQKISDPTCGLRLYNWVVMNEFKINKKMEVEPASIAYVTKRKKLKIKEVGTTVFKREHGESTFAKKSNVIKYMFRQTFKMIFLWTNKDYEVKDNA